MTEKSGGVEVEVVYDAEKADVVICRLVREGEIEPFDDNEHCPCADCGRMVMHRPNLPKAALKMCAECALSLVETAKGGTQ